MQAPGHSRLGEFISGLLAGFLNRLIRVPKPCCELLFPWAALVMLCFLHLHVPTKWASRCLQNKWEVPCKIIKCWGLWKKYLVTSLKGIRDRFLLYSKLVHNTLGFIWWWFKTLTTHTIPEAHRPLAIFSTPWCCHGRDPASGGSLGLSLHISLFREKRKQTFQPCPQSAAGSVYHSPGSYGKNPL